MPKQHRLPVHLIPERYRLVLHPDLEGFLFSGEETIYLQLNKNTKQIILHAMELEIFFAEFRQGKTSFKVKQVDYNKKKESATLDFGQILPKGAAELTLKFKGVLNDKMRGFYRSKYFHAGKEHFIATTQFEATDARRAFPCVDEPAAKAIFDVTLIVPEKMSAVSNTLISRVAEHSAGFKLVEFAPTPKMSTYLLAFIVGNLEFIEARTQRNVLVRAFTTPGKKHQAQFALSCATRALDFYEKYFGINYPLPILDMIAIPDFASAAMENWGAIVYRETALLVDSDNSSVSTKQWVAIVVAHEIAHMWFGNLVTMDWWTHLWLNEGFASYMEYKCVDALFPEWHMWEQYVSGRLSSALRLDALQNTHAVEIEVKHPSEISEIFDEVSYAKGSAVIRMLAEFLGDKSFQKGLSHYLQKHSYKNTRTEDLWKSLEFVSGKPVKRIMNTWTKQPGYPRISVRKSPKGFILKQNRFFSSRLSERANRASQLWKVPLALNGKKLLLEKQSLVLKENLQHNKINLGETSLVRVSYPKEILQNFGPQVQKKQLAVVDRLGLVRDAFAMAECGQLQTLEALKFALNYKNEDNLVVWEEIADALSRMRNLLYGQEGHKAFLSYSKEIFSEQFGKLGWQIKKTDSHGQRLLRGLIINQLGACGEEKIVRQAIVLLHAKGIIHADIRSAVYNTAARHGGENEYKALLAKYHASHQHEEQERIGRALSQFRNPKLLRKALDFSLTKHVRYQDAPFMLASALQNSVNRDLVWKFITNNWQELVKRYGDGLGLLGRLLKAAGVFTHKEKAEELNKFFKLHPTMGASRTIRQVLEKILSNADWLKREQKDLNAWLLKNYEK